MGVVGSGGWWDGEEEVWSSSVGGASWEEEEEVWSSSVGVGESCSGVDSSSDSSSISSSKLSSGKVTAHGIVNEAYKVDSCV